jgi:hypothetical protein
VCGAVDDVEAVEGAPLVDSQSAQMQLPWHAYWEVVTFRQHFRSACAVGQNASGAAQGKAAIVPKQALFIPTESPISIALSVSGFHRRAGRLCDGRDAPTLMSSLAAPGGEKRRNSVTDRAAMWDKTIEAAKVAPPVVSAPVEVRARADLPCPALTPLAQPLVKSGSLAERMQALSATAATPAPAPAAPQAQATLVTQGSVAQRVQGLAGAPAASGEGAPAPAPSASTATRKLSSGGYDVKCKSCGKTAYPNESMTYEKVRSRRPPALVNAPRRTPITRLASSARLASKCALRRVAALSLTTLQRRGCFEIRRYH